MSLWTGHRQKKKRIINNITIFAISNNKNTNDRNTQRLAISALKANAANPRKIRDDKFHKLVDSLLIFPNMLELRPVVVDGSNTVLGGNMRLRALDTIAQMTPEELAERLGHIRQYKSKKKAEKEYLQSYWASFLDKPECPVLHADDLTPEQVKEFIVKDNVAFGSWDWDELGNTWDSEDLSDWGLDVWNEPASSEHVIGAGLPSEIEGLDLSPEEIPVIEGDDQTAMERVIYNCNSSEKRAKFHSMTMAEYMRWLWNNPQAGQSPYTMFGGVMEPSGKDDEGNLIYRYRKDRTITD